jgi:hypothetical protein
MLSNKDTPRRIKQRQDCQTVQEIRDYLSQYFDLHDRYQNRQFGKQSNFTLVYKDKVKGNNHSNINITLIWYNNEELVTEIKLEWYRGWRDEDRAYKNYDWTFNNENYNEEGWYLWNEQGRRNLIESCHIFTEITNFILTHEEELPTALLREKKLKQLLNN